VRILFVASPAFGYGNKIGADRRWQERTARTAQWRQLVNDLVHCRCSNIALTRTLPRAPDLQEKSNFRCRYQHAFS
jgi:hypothetical protein